MVGFEYITKVNIGDEIFSQSLHGNIMNFVKIFSPEQNITDRY